MKIINNIEINKTHSIVDYKQAVSYMEQRVSEIAIQKKKELIWFLQHDHIYTIGASGQENEIHHKMNIPYIKTNRGGKVTYHGPGQRIVYFLIDLKKRRKDVRKFVNLIEKSAIDLLNEFDVEAKTFSNRVGIWVIKNKKIKLNKEEKIGAIGLRVKKWVVYHGLSFNINPDLNYYKNIDPCGLPEYSITSLESLGIKISNQDFDDLYLKFFLKHLKKL